MVSGIMGINVKEKYKPRVEKLIDCVLATKTGSHKGVTKIDYLQFNFVYLRVVVPLWLFSPHLMIKKKRYFQVLIINIIIQNRLDIFNV